MVAVTKVITKKKHILVMSLILLAFVVFFAIIAKFAYTPTTNINVVNNTNATVEVSVCGSDPATLDPGARVSIETSSNDQKVGCAIYNSLGKYTGCLATPTNGTIHTFYVTDSKKSIPESACGD